MQWNQNAVINVPESCHAQPCDHGQSNYPQLNVCLNPNDPQWPLQVTDYRNDRAMDFTPPCLESFTVNLSHDVPTLYLGETVNREFLDITQIIIQNSTSYNFLLPAHKWKSSCRKQPHYNYHTWPYRCKWNQALESIGNKPCKHFFT